MGILASEHKETINRRIVNINSAAKKKSAIKVITCYLQRSPKKLSKNSKN